MDNFLKELEESLRGEVPDSVVRETLSYYRNYFAQQRAQGVTEQEVAASLGSGRIIARSVIEANRMDNRDTIYADEPGLREEAASRSGSGIFDKLKTIAVIMKLLSSRDAKKAYTHATAAALRMKESVMETVTTVQENAADIVASAKDLNAQRAEQEAPDASEQAQET